METNTNTINNNNNNNIFNNGYQVQFFSVENSTNIKLGTQIRKEIDNLADHFMALDDDERNIKRDKKSIILEMADKFERLHEIGEYDLPIHNICSSIYRYLQRKGLDISDRYIQQVLKENAPQYLNPSYQHTNHTAIDIKLQQDEILGALKTLKNANLKVLKDETIQDAIPEIYEIVDLYEECADERHITAAPIRQQTAQIPHYDAQDLDPFKDTVKTDIPDPRDTPSPLASATMALGESFIELGRTFVSTAKMMEMYPPDEKDRELEIHAVERILNWKKFWDLLKDAMKSGTDRKYRRSICQWVQIAQTEEDYGKHAASSKHPYMAKVKDPVTGEWHEEIRKLTREQIGDKAVRVREFTKLFKQSVPWALDIIKWSEKYLHPHTNSLSIRLHEKLSDRSLR
ncbi:MAG: hypothetical protein ACM3X1_02645 [Ignavibacteriales bacterium]